MGNADMSYAIFIALPLHFGIAARFAVDDINVFYLVVAHTFKDTVSNSKPSVFFCVLDFDSKAINFYVREGVWVKSWTNVDARLSGCNFQHFPDLLFKCFRVSIEFAGP